MKARTKNLKIILSILAIKFWIAFGIFATVQILGLKFHYYEAALCLVWFFVLIVDGILIMNIYDIKNSY